MYSDPQKIVVSIDVALFSCADSKIHTSLPSSLTSFHHLNPTSILPDTFFTNQKSNAPKITTRINIKASDKPNIFKNRKNIIAQTLNIKVKKTITGW